MLPQSSGKPDPLKLLELRANAKVLAESLRNELQALEARVDASEHLKDIYDAVYLPRVAALAGELTFFDLPEIEVLRQPFELARASAQLQTLIRLLESIVVILSPN